ncbi:uncharacterized protein LOC142170639 [Nicotiana tabacum]|uniref:Uncharacterized protein LOC142170639 n=1 Tax=Nicotiana tabacum TaxID=4097 RepID=A0AC58SUM3_TOBAC
MLINLVQMVIVMEMQRKRKQLGDPVKWRLLQFIGLGNPRKAERSKRNSKSSSSSSFFVSPSPSPTFLSPATSPVGTPTSYISIPPSASISSPSESPSPSSSVFLNPTSSPVSPPTPAPHAPVDPPVLPRKWQPSHSQLPSTAPTPDQTNKRTSTSKRHIMFIVSGVAELLYLYSFQPFCMFIVEEVRW